MDQDVVDRAALDDLAAQHDRDAVGGATAGEPDIF
jgi:hypothetical protein